MNTIKSTLETTTMFSDDKQHRYLLNKTWDKEKQTVTVMNCYPNYDGTLALDLTTQLIMNKISEMEDFGAVNFVNLYSNLKHRLILSI